MKRGETVVLRSALGLEECKRRLADAIDCEEWTLFSLSGYKGSKDVLGTLRNNTFRIQKRRWYRNDFAPNFYGELSLGQGGTQVKGHFDVPEWTRIFMWGWLVCVALLGIPLFLLSLSDFLLGTAFIHGDPGLGLLVPPGMILFGLLLPRFGFFLGSDEQKVLLQFLAHTLAAEPGGNQPRLQ